MADLPEPDKLEIQANSSCTPEIGDAEVSQQTSLEECQAITQFISVNLELKTDSAVTDQPVVLNMESSEIKSANISDGNITSKHSNSEAPIGLFVEYSKVKSVEEVLENTDDSNKQPALLEFFAEDRCGTDTDGKAFFEKIAQEKCVVDTETVNTQVLCEPVTSPKPELPFQQLGDAVESEIYSMWVPSHEIQNIFLKLAKALPGTFSIDKGMITTPSVIIEDEMEDPLKLVLRESNTAVAQQRKVLTANDVPQNEIGLNTLIKANCFHAAINLTTRLLKSLASYGSMIVPPSPQSLQLWFIRFALFVKLRKFSCVEVESESFGELDNPDLYYEFYTGNRLLKTGTMVPFSLRLLLAELPQYLENHQLALNKLYKIHHVISEILNNLHTDNTESCSIQLTDTERKTAIDLWNERERRVLYSILNCFLGERDYVMAISLAEQLIEKDEVHRAELYSSLGRIYLQLGDMKEAQNCFNLADASAGTKSDNYLQLINRALIAISLSNNEEAYKCYHKALTIRQNDPMLINNLSVCLLYMGRLKESLSLLEQAIQKNPKECLHDSIMFNVCTLYELESSHCTTKKHAMLKLISKYAGDNFSVSSLKIVPNAKV